jgi:hypothetical protein
VLNVAHPASCKPRAYGSCRKPQIYLFQQKRGTSEFISNSQSSSFPLARFCVGFLVVVGLFLFINFGVNLEDPTGCRSWRPWHTARTMVMFLLTEGLASGRMAAGLVRTLLPHMHPSHATLRPHRIPSHVPVPRIPSHATRAPRPIPCQRLHPNAANLITPTPTPTPRRDEEKGRKGRERRGRGTPHELGAEALR